MLSWVRDGHLDFDTMKGRTQEVLAAAKVEREAIYAAEKKAAEEAAAKAAAAPKAAQVKLTTFGEGEGNWTEFEKLHGKVKAMGDTFAEQHIKAAFDEKAKYPWTRSLDIIQDEKGAILGAIGYSEYSEQFYINALGVTKKGKGVGTRLIQEVSRKAAELDRGLKAFASSNEEAIFKKLGFKQTEKYVVEMTAAETKKLAAQPLQEIGLPQQQQAAKTAKKVSQAKGDFQAGLWTDMELESIRKAKGNFELAYATEAGAQQTYAALQDGLRRDPLELGLLRDSKGKILGAVSYRATNAVIRVSHVGAIAEGKGVGKRLMYELAAVAHDRGKVLLVNATEETAAFFKSLGMKPVAGLENSYVWEKADLKKIAAKALSNKTPKIKGTPWKVAPNLKAISTAEAMASTDKFDRLLDAANNYASSEATKGNIAKDLGKRLKGDTKFTEFAKLLEGKYRSEYGWQGDTLEEKACSHLVSTWASTSGDSHPLAVAMQLAAEVEFDLQDVELWWDYEVKEKAIDIYGKHMGAMREFLRAQYENTQDWFRKQGVTHVPLVRGAGWSGDNLPNGYKTSHFDGVSRIEEVILQPMSSFATDPDICNGFASGSYRVFMGANIPVERIIGTCQTGYGCKSEREMVVLGGTEKFWSIMFTRSNGPSTTQRGIWEAVLKAATK